MGASINLARIIYHLKIWLMMSKNSFLVVLNHKSQLLIFLIGKFLRFGLFLSFLYFLVIEAESVAGYTVNQAIFFFLTFNVVDIFSQFLFREVYRFRQLLITGDFDLILAKPMNALVRILLGGADIIDLLTIPPLLFTVWYVGSLLNPSLLQIIFYILLILNGLVIAAAFHIATISMGIITLEVDHTINIYRDTMNLGKFPIDIYKEPLKGFLTYLIPVGVMISWPAKAFLGLLSPSGIIISFSLGIGVMFLSIRFWNIALKKYTSASS